MQNMHQLCINFAKSMQQIRIKFAAHMQQTCKLCISKTCNKNDHTFWFAINMQHICTNMLEIWTNMQGVRKWIWFQKYAKICNKYTKYAKHAIDDLHSQKIQNMHSPLCRVPLLEGCRERGRCKRATVRRPRWEGRGERSHWLDFLRSRRCRLLLKALLPLSARDKHMLPTLPRWREADRGFPSSSPSSSPPAKFPVDQAHLGRSDVRWLVLQGFAIGKPRICKNKQHTCKMRKKYAFTMH